MTKHERSAREKDATVSDGVVLRPEAFVLSDDALIPESNLIDPPSEPFTHVLIKDEPYWFDGNQGDEKPSGTLVAGTPVIVLHEGPGKYRVVDSRGLVVDVPLSSVRPLKRPSQRA